jgi:hypothetical protein
VVALYLLVDVRSQRCQCVFCEAHKAVRAAHTACDAPVLAQPAIRHQYTAVIHVSVYQWPCTGRTGSALTALALPAHVVALNMALCVCVPTLQSAQGCYWREQFTACTMFLDVS